MLKKVCVITGSRADYGIFFPVIQKIRASKRLKLQLVATCMHLMKEFGYTINEIKKDGVPISAAIDISYSDDSHKAMADAMGSLTSKLTAVLCKLKPDLVLLLGDRGEMLASAFVANYLNIPVGHIHGGEISGHVDGIFRHAITKLSHLHFASTKKSAERIVKLGEDPKTVFVTGAPALDRILTADFSSKKLLIRKYGLTPGKPVVMLAQHPVSSEINLSARNMKISLQALAELKHRTIVIYPNADAGGREMIKVIRSYTSKYPFITAFKSIPHKDYLGLMKISSVLAGNSSSGLIEAPSFHLPVINIGNRQQGREIAGNVLNAPFVKEKIKQSIRDALNNKTFINKVKNTANPYGKGTASANIVKILEKCKLNRDLINKRLTY